jgi:hypothetical protein
MPNVRSISTDIIINQIDTVNSTIDVFMDITIGDASRNDCVILLKEWKAFSSQSEHITTTSTSTIQQSTTNSAQCLEIAIKLLQKLQEQDTPINQNSVSIFWYNCLEHDEPCFYVNTSGTTCTSSFRVKLTCKNSLSRNMYLFPFDDSRVVFSFAFSKELSTLENSKVFLTCSDIEFFSHPTFRCLRINNDEVVEFRVLRRPLFYIWNIVIPNFLIVCFVFAFANVSSLENRLGTFVSIILTLVGVKITVSGYVPKLPSTTLLDKQVLCSFLVVFIAGIESFLVCPKLSDDDSDTMLIDYYFFVALSLFWLSFHLFLLHLTFCRNPPVTSEKLECEWKREKSLQFNES